MHKYFPVKMQVFTLTGKSACVSIDVCDTFLCCRNYGSGTLVSFSNLFRIVPRYLLKIIGISSISFFTFSSHAISEKRGLCHMSTSISTWTHKLSRESCMRDSDKIATIAVAKITCFF